MRTRVVPASELSSKSLRAEDYVKLPANKPDKPEQSWPRYEVVVEQDDRGEGGIYIYRRAKKGGRRKEMVMWDSAEWKEDPSVTFVIVNAVCSALMDVGYADKVYKSLGKL